MTPDPLFMHKLWFPLYVPLDVLLCILNGLPSFETLDWSPLVLTLMCGCVPVLMRLWV